MNFFSLISVELKKIKRSKILLILLVPVIMMWIPGIINSDLIFALLHYAGSLRCLLRIHFFPSINRASGRIRTR